MDANFHPLKKLRAAWYSMLNRAAGLGRGRGREVCEDWSDFQNFADHVGAPPSSKHVLCLRVPDLGFQPGNVYWVTRQDVQQYVQHARVVSFNGRDLSLSAWARELGVLQETLRHRLDQGQSLDQVLSDQRWPNRYAPRTRKSHRTSSRFIGVSYRPHDVSWEAKIRVRRRLCYLGVYHSEQDAAAAVRKARELVAAAGAESLDDLVQLLRREIVERPRVRRPERKSRCKMASVVVG